MAKPLWAYRPTIADLMWLIVVVALAVAVPRMGVSRGMVLPMLLGLAVGLPVLQWVWFVTTPKRIIPWLARGDEAFQRRWLRRVIATPLTSGKLKVLARLLLLVQEKHARRYVEAEQEARAILAIKGGNLDPALRSSIRQHLVDCLEALGRRDEADAQRRGADDDLMGSSETFLGRQAQAKLFERENRHAEAYEAFERGLALVPPRHKHVRAEFMSQLALSSFNAGRPADTARWAEAVMAMKTRKEFTQLGRRLASIAYGNLGRLDEAERFAREAAEHAPDPAARSEALALAASYACRLGALDRAGRDAREAEALSPGTGMVTWSVLADIARIRGRFDEGIKAYQDARSARPIAIASGQRRVTAVIAKEEARLLGHLDRTDEALALLNQAETELGNDPKLGPALDAAFAWVLALRGDRDAARARLASAENRRQDVLDSRTSQAGILSDLGLAALALDDPEEAETFFRGYLEIGPDPVYRPSVLYYLAECRRLLGDRGQARALDREAASTDFGTLYERLARERLTLLNVEDQ